MLTLFRVPVLLLFLFGFFFGFMSHAGWEHGERIYGPPQHHPSIPEHWKMQQ
jgi:hypothetical protein